MEPGPLGSKPDPLLRRWHRCRTWMDRKMPCPFQHEGEIEPPKSEPGNPFNWIKDVYLRDINISHRTGWSGPAHDRFVEPFGNVYGFEDTPQKEEQHRSYPNEVFKEVLQEFGARTGTYPPADAYATNEDWERGVEMMWPPVADKTLTGLYPPRDAIGSGMDFQRPFQMHWEEVALATEVETFQNPMPGSTPGGFPHVEGPGSEPGTFGGYGGYNTIADTFEKMRDLITPKFRQADLEL